MNTFEPLSFPAWATWGQRRGIDLPQPEGRGPNGRKLCRWCGSEVPPRRLSWCSDACSHRYLRVFTWGAVRQYVMERDGFTCVRCTATHPGWKRGLFRRRLVWAKQRKDRYWVEWHDLVEDWQVDHIVPVRNGGTDDPENLRLLCHACHVAAGYEQRRAEKSQLDVIPLSPVARPRARRSRESNE